MTGGCRRREFVDGDDLLNIDRFFISDPGRFHDARLERLSIATCGSDDGIGIELCLKGPYFDLHYGSVVSCKVDVPESDKDLLMHEIRIENELLAHEVLFDGGGRIEIACGGLRFRETTITPQFQTT